MLQPPLLKYHMKTIGTDWWFSNSAIFEHRWLQNIKKLYKHSGKCDNQQQFKDIFEAAMVSNPEGFTNNSPISPMTTPTIKKPSARKSLCLFTNILHVKKKTAIRWVRTAKSKCKVIKAGTMPCALKPKQKGNPMIKDHMNKALYSSIINHPQVVQSPIANYCLKMNIDGPNIPQIVPKLLLQVSVRELHNILASDPADGVLKKRQEMQRIIFLSVILH